MGTFIFNDLNIFDLINIYNNMKDIQTRVSIFSLFQLLSYGIKVSYLYNNRNYFFKIKATSQYEGYFLSKDEYYGMLINDIKKLKEDYIFKFIEILKFNKIKYFVSEEIDKKFLDKYNFKISNDKTIISNYIYETEYIKGFPGKKMQKKRNLLNYFSKNYNEAKLSIISKDNIEDIKKFVIANSNNRNYEINSYSHIFDLSVEYPNIFKGSVLKNNNKTIGATIGIINGDFYEIVIEKASKEYKGVFQFLLSENLRLNNISQKFIDRQDDEGTSSTNIGLRISKNSYHPVEKKKLYIYEY
ncbi:MAG: phosphatidylglycerol lysyltransferase domain-containing protein [Mycoplasmoidaceae bacterium]